MTEKKRFKLNYLGYSCFLLIFILIINFSMCKTSSESENSDQFILKVEVSEGIDGNPQNGETSYSKGDTVSYNYQLKNEYKNLKVTLDGANVNPTGTITMDMNHSLKATAEVDNTVNYSIIANVGEGVSGTPVSGTQTLSENSKVSYSYQLDDGYHDLVVTLDGNKVDDKGEITMDKDHTLSALAEKGYDMRGEWELNLNLSNATSSASILETLTVNIEFTGSLKSGNVYIGGNKVGSYTVDNEKVTFSYTIPDNTYGKLFYDYVGKFTGNDDMSGDVTVYYDNGFPSESLKEPEVYIKCKKGKWSGKRKRH